MLNGQQHEIGKKRTNPKISYSTAIKGSNNTGGLSAVNPEKLTVLTTGF